jgi:hypothetical protein
LDLINLALVLGELEGDQCLLGAVEPVLMLVGTSDMFVFSVW